MSAASYHAVRRAAERYGIAASEELIRSICRLIRRRLSRPRHIPLPDFRIEGKPRHGRAKCYVQIDGNAYSVIYSIPTDTIITFLPGGFIGADRP